MKYLHIIGCDKFLKSFVRFTNANFLEEDHLFIVTGFNKDYEVPSVSNVIDLTGFSNAFSSFKILVNKMAEAEKIFIHGLFNPLLILFLFFNKAKLPYSYWLILGGDLYFDQSEGGIFKKKLINPFRRIVVAKIGFFLTYIDEDFKYLKSHFEISGIMKKTLLYPSNVIHNSSSELDFNKDKSFNKILIGNSATPSNRHFGVIDLLSRKVSSDHIELIFPLSYGGINYRNEVVSLASQKLSKNYKLTFLTDFLPLEEYELVLREVSIVIFNHNRQQAMGNIIQLLNMGKTIYLPKESPVSSFLTRLKLNFKFVSDFDFSHITKEEALSNQQIVKDFFSESVLISDWKKIFTDKV